MHPIRLSGNGQLVSDKVSKLKKKKNPPAVIWLAGNSCPLLPSRRRLPAAAAATSCCKAEAVNVWVIRVPFYQIRSINKLIFKTQFFQWKLIRLKLYHCFSYCASSIGEIEFKLSIWRWTVFSIFFFFKERASNADDGRYHLQWGVEELVWGAFFYHQQIDI